MAKRSKQTKFNPAIDMRIKFYFDMQVQLDFDFQAALLIIRWVYLAGLFRNEATSANAW